MKRNFFIWIFVDVDDDEEDDYEEDAPEEGFEEHMDAPDTTQDAYRSKFLLNKEFDDFFIIIKSNSVFLFL